jgi:hypothetical protein
MRWATGISVRGAGPAGGHGHGVQLLLRDSDIERQRSFGAIAQQSMAAVDPRYPLGTEEIASAQGSQTV